MNKGRKSSNLVKSNEWHCTCAISAHVIQFVAIMQICKEGFKAIFLKFIWWICNSGLKVSNLNVPYIT